MTPTGMAHEMAREELEAFVDGREDLRRLTRVRDRQRVRIERHHPCAVDGAVGTARGERVVNGAMSAVHPVVHADGHRAARRRERLQLFQ